MRFLFTTLSIIFMHGSFAQDSLTVKQNVLQHSLRLTGYSSDYSKRYGGAQLDYQLSYNLNSKLKMIGKLGYFYLSVPNDTYKGIQPPRMKYQYLAFAAGIQRAISPRNKVYFEFDLAVPILRYEDSKFITNTFWSDYVHAHTGSDEKRKFIFIQELSFGYYFNKHFSASIGERLIFATLKKRPKPNQSFAIDLGFSVSINYTF
jgi:hypothetical protein